MCTSGVFRVAFLFSLSPKPNFAMTLAEFQHFMKKPIFVNVTQNAMLSCTHEKHSDPSKRSFMRLYLLLVHVDPFVPVHLIKQVDFLAASVSYVEQVLGVEFPPNQRWYCRIQQITLYSSFMWSCYLLITMTFERFYSIIRPHKAASLNTVKKAKILICCVFIFGFIYSVPYLFITDNSGKLCVPNRFASDNGFGELYYWLTEILIFIFPCFSLLAMNSIIIHTLRKRSKQKLTETSSEGQTEGQTLKRKQSEKQIVTMLLVITFVFVALNITTRALVFYLTFYSSDTPYYFAGLHLFYQIGEKAFYTNHGINFFLYVMSGQTFRTDLKELFVAKNLIKYEAPL